MAREPLTQDYDANQVFAAPPRGLSGRIGRWFTITFVESWLAVFLFRLKARLRGAGVPLLPGVCGMVSRVLFNVHIGDEVQVGRGLVIPHGNVVIDGRTTIGRDFQVNPWVTIGLSNSRKLGFSVDGPTIGDHVHIGTGAKIMGPVRIGDYARIGANAVVVHDVPANTTVVGVPARPVHSTASSSTTHDASGRDERLAAHMRASIVDYLLRRQSLSSLVDALSGSFEIGSERLKALQTDLKNDLTVLEQAAARGDQAPQVRAAVDRIDGALRGVLEEAATP